MQGSEGECILMVKVLHYVIQGRKTKSFYKNKVVDDTLNPTGTVELVVFIVEWIIAVN